MKPLKPFSTITLLIFFFPSWIHVFGGIPDYTEADALKFMEVFDKFGNRGVHIDFDNMILIFLHEDEEQKKTYKGFHVETSREFLPFEENVAPDRNVLVYHLTPYVHSAPNQSVKLDDQFDISEYEHWAIDEKINLSKTYYKFMVFFVPHDYPHADIRGPETLDLVRKRRYTHDLETGDVTKIEEFQIRKVEDGGMVFRVTTIVPEQPLDEDEALWWIDGRHNNSTPSESETDRELKIYLRIPVPTSNPEKYEILEPANVSPKGTMLETRSIDDRKFSYRDDVLKAVAASNDMQHQMKRNTATTLGAFITGTPMLGKCHWPWNKFRGRLAGDVSYQFRAKRKSYWFEKSLVSPLSTIR